MTLGDSEGFDEVAAHLKRSTGEDWYFNHWLGLFETRNGGPLYYTREQSYALYLWHLSPSKHPHPGPPNDERKEIES